MAKLRVYQTITNKVWTLRFVNDLTDLSSSDKILMEKFGEPEIDLGGIFLDGTANEFTLPNSYVHIKSDFPIVKEFDSLTSPFNSNTQIKVEGYRDEIVSRFTTALTTLRANTDAFTSEKVYDNL